MNDDGSGTSAWSLFHAERALWNLAAVNMQKSRFLKQT